MKLLNNIKHTGIVVEDIDESIKFYTKLLGLKEIERGILECDEVLKLIGIIGSDLTWVILSTQDNDIQLELYHIHNKEIREHYFNFKCEEGYIDFQHICFSINNIEKLFTTLSKNNVTCISEPSIDSKCKNKQFFARDIDGNLLEFVEVI